jgi:hypothetical protein
MHHSIRQREVFTIGKGEMVDAIEYLVEQMQHGYPRPSQ